MALTKTVRFDQETLDILSRQFRVTSGDGQFVGTLTSGQLDRKAYEKVNKALEILGGKWNKKAKGHIFSTDPRLQLEGLLDTGSATVAKEGWFPTPPSVIERMWNLAPYDGHGFILEPSAGEGAIVDWLVNQRGISKRVIECVELNPHRAEILRKKNYVVEGRDFMTVTPRTFNLDGFSRIYMNPPFEQFQDVEHVQHAYNLLAPDGRLVSIMGESVFFRQDTKAKDFRQWLDEVGGYSEKLPDGSFKESGTGVAARIVVIDR